VEGRAGHHRCDADVERAHPSAGARRNRRRPSVRHLTGDDEIGRDQSAPVGGQPAEQFRADRPRWIRHHLERLSGEAEVRGVGPHDPDRSRPGRPVPTARRIDVESTPSGCRLALARRIDVESAPKGGQTVGVELDGDDASAGGHQGRGQSTGAGTDVEHEVAWIDPRRIDDLSCDGVSELVEPPPASTAGGHDAPSRRRTWPHLRRPIGATPTNSGMMREGRPTAT
jgi:hypothetical protein